MHKMKMALLIVAGIFSIFAGVFLASVYTLSNICCFIQTTDAPKKG